MLDDHLKPWRAVLLGTTIVALQHECGVNDAPINCYIDAHANYSCPNCLTTYGAPTPIDATSQQSVATIHVMGEDTE